MSDEDHTVFTPPRAAIPSRQGTAPLPAPMFDEPVKRLAKLQRKHPLSKKRTARAKLTRVARKARTPKPAKNPNRPLELKNQLSAVLRLTSTLTKAELAWFTVGLDMASKLSRSSRKRVLAAFAQVYG